MRFPLSLTTTMIGYIAKKKITRTKKFPLVLMLEPLHACNLTRSRAHEPRRDPPAAPIERRFDGGRDQQAAAAVAGGRRVLHGIARHDDPEYRRSRRSRRAQRGAAQHESGARELHAEPRGVHPDQRLDGEPLRHAAGVRRRDRHLHAGLAALRASRTTSTCWSRAASCRAAAAR